MEHSSLVQCKNGRPLVDVIENYTPYRKLYGPNVGWVSTSFFASVPTACRCGLLIPSGSTFRKKLWLETVSPRDLFDFNTVLLKLQDSAGDPKLYEFTIVVNYSRHV
nr:hypothetical protein HmN_000944500 [Hymenolepis microstoma]